MDFGNIEIIYHRHNKMTKFSAMPRGEIAYNELTVLFSGTMEYRVDGIPCPMKSGDAVFIPDGHTRERKKEETPADYISFNFTSDITFDFFAPHTSGVADRELNLLLLYYDECAAADLPSTKEKCKAVLMCMLCKLYDITAAPRYDDITQKIINYLHENIDRRVTLEELGKITYSSPVYCGNVFKKNTGKSVIRYFNELKMEKAKGMILENVSLTKIALRLGFDDYNYFSRLFKKLCGCPPKQYGQRYFV